MGSTAPTNWKRDKAYYRVVRRDRDRGQDIYASVNGEYSCLIQDGATVLIPKLVAKSLQEIKLTEWKQGSIDLEGAVRTKVEIPRFDVYEITDPALQINEGLKELENFER